jgi:hypothetical protein
MITGYNTDVEHDGVIYHVQTEDKGLATPLLLSLVYAGGEILASKRSSYHDLIAAGFDESVLTERLQRQHRLICAAINAGRIADLRKLGAPPRKASSPSPRPPHQETVEEPAVESAGLNETETETLPPVADADIAPPSSPTPQAKPPASPYTVYDSRRRSPLADVPEVEEGLRINLVGEKDFRGGDEVELQVTVTRVSAAGEVPAIATVSVKILGTSFRPVILSLKTTRQGITTVSTRIPPFKSGRAAIVIRASAADLSAETRRVIHPAL